MGIVLPNFILSNYLFHSNFDEFSEEENINNENVIVFSKKKMLEMKFNLLTPTLNFTNCLSLSLLEGHLDLHNFILMIIQIVDKIEKETEETVSYKFIKTMNLNSTFGKSINLMRYDEKQDSTIPDHQQSFLDVPVQEVEVEVVTSFPSLDLEGLVLLDSMKVLDTILISKNENKSASSNKNENNYENKIEDNNENDNENNNEKIIWTDDDIQKVFELIINGNINCFIELVKMNYDVNLTLKDGITTWMVAAKGGKIEILNIILNRNIDLSLMDKNKKNIFHYAAMSSDDRMVAYLLSHNKFEKCKNAQNPINQLNCLY